MKGYIQLFDLAKFRLRRITSRLLRFLQLGGLAGSSINNQTGWVRVIVLVIVLWSALVAWSLAWYMRHEQQSILSTATVAVRANINKDINFRKWAATHGGVYAPPTEHTPPNPYLKVPERDVVTTTGKTLTLMNPAYMLRQMQSDFPGDYGTRSHITSLKPINPNNAPDAWEAKALHGFEQGSKELLETQQIDGQPYLRMMLPLIVEQGCLKCHAQQGYKLGDIRGGISSDVPLAHFSALERGFRGSLILGHGASWLLGLAGLAWLGISYRRVRRLEILTSSVAAVEESERRFRAIAQSANDAIISADSVGNVVGWNAAAERLFGYTEAEIVGQPLTVLMPERFHKLHREGLARVVAGGVPHVIGKTVELAGLRKDGSEFPLEISLAQWQAAEGQFFTAIIRDIAERKQAEQTLLESENKYRRLIENSPDIAYTFSVKRGGIYFSSQVITILGYSVEHLYDYPFLWNESIHPEDRAVVAKAVEEFKIGTPFKIEYRIKNARGDWRWFYDRSIGGREENGDFIIEGLAMDITERKQAEQVIAESESRFREIFNAGSDAIFIHDAATGRIIDVNQRMLDMYGFTREEALACGPDDLSAGTPPYSSAEAIEKIRLAHTEGPQIFDWLARARDGHLFWSEVNLRFVLIGNQRRILAVVRDITERKLAEAKLAEQLDELRRWHNATSGREGRILELKHEMNELLGKSGLPPRYPSAESQNQTEK